MPTKPLDRLMFVQGGLCFFCKQPLPKAEASVEHLQASANGGNNNDENCVACCKAVNAMLGSMSLKEKFQVVLNQQGKFKCPNGAGSVKPVVQPKAAAKIPVKVAAKDSKFEQVVVNLRQRGNSKPRTLKTLASTISVLFQKNITEQEINSLIKQLQTNGMLTVSENKVSYAL